MELLYNLGIKDEEIKKMLKQCPNILDMEDYEIREKIEILIFVGCNDRYIRNIIVSNPHYFNRLNNDILKLIGYLKEIGLSDIDLLFDANPYLLDKDAFEIKDYVNCRLENGITLEDVVNEIDSNPYIIDEN